MEFKTLIREALVYAPGCPQKLVIDKLRQVTEELAKATDIVVKDIDVGLLVVDQDAYELVAPVGYVIDRVLSAKLGDNYLTATTKASINSIGQLCLCVAGDTDIKTIDAVGTPSHYLQRLPSVITVYPTPNVALVELLSVEVSVSPSFTATGFDDEFMTQYRKILVDGAIGELLTIPFKAWTNDKRGERYKKQFDEKVTQIRMELVRGFQRQDNKRRRTKAWV